MYLSYVLQLYELRVNVSFNAASRFADIHERKDKKENYFIQLQY